MTSGMSERRRHFLLERVTETEAFRPGGRGQGTKVRELDRVPHSASLRGQLRDLRNYYRVRVKPMDRYAEAYAGHR